MEPVINAFVKYLYDTGYIVNLTVGIDLAAKIYNEQFKQPKIPFKRFLRAMNNLCIISVRTNSTLVFVSRSLHSIIRYSGAGNTLQGVVPLRATPRRSFIVSQTAAFKERRRPEDLVSETTCKVCNVTFGNESEHDAHLLDVRHVMRTEYITQRFVYGNVFFHFFYFCNCMT